MVSSIFCIRLFNADVLVCSSVSFCFCVSSKRSAVSLSSIIPHVVHRMSPKEFLLPHLGQFISLAIPSTFDEVFNPCSSSIASSRSRAEKCTYRLVILLPYVHPANCSSRLSVNTFAIVVSELWRYRYGHMFRFSPAF